MKNKSLFVTSLVILSSVSMLSGCNKSDPTITPTHTPTPAPTESKYELNVQSNKVEVDETGYGELRVEDYDFCFSNVTNDEEGYINILDRGIVANKTAINGIVSLEINFKVLPLTTEVDLYYGISFLSIDNKTKLKQTNEITLETYCNYFVIQSSGECVIDSINIKYFSKEEVVEDKLPVINVTTIPENTPVTSRSKYVTCNVEVTDPDNEEYNLESSPCSIKVRGESSSGCPKVGYRLKFDKKQSLFGLKKNKSWVLVADYLDGSKLHNWGALEFAKIVRDDGSFTINQKHVNLFLNGKDMGIYLFAEHINENAGRLDIAQDNVWEKSFNDINFYVERNLYTDYDEKDRSFTIDTSSGYYSHIKSYTFILKYPTSEDFVEELADGTTNPHTEEYNAFFNELKELYTNIVNAFKKYYASNMYFDLIDELIDCSSLAMYGAIDQVFAETDHEQKSFKMYRVNGSKVRFGPNWDYDSCSVGLHYNKGKYERTPYTSEERLFNTFYTTWFGEKWAYLLFKDTKNGVKYFKEIWDKISDEMINKYLLGQMDEMRHLSSYYKSDTNIWMDNEYRCVFDNFTYYFEWMTTQTRYLKNYYSNIKG